MLIGDLTGISQVVEGDLVYSKESPPGEATSVDTSEADDDHTNSSEIDMCSETLPEEMIQSVKVFYKQCGIHVHVQKLPLKFLVIHVCFACR